MILTSSQKSILDQLIEFVTSPEKGVFILKGYAGTGKTTMIGHLINYLKSQGLKNIVMAPTGRAAKVLRDKVGDGITIHKAIYNFASLQCIETFSDDVSKKSFHYYFPLFNTLTNDNLVDVVIVDESSMVSDVEVHGEFFTFGSGKLLSDLLEYANNMGVSKLVFVGDDAQLPPVTDSRSQALNVDFFVSKGVSVKTATLTEVVRQDKDSGILLVANRIRELLNLRPQMRQNFSINENQQDIHLLKTEDVVEKYLDLYPIPEVGNGVIINYSNSQCQFYNSAIRNRLYGKETEIQPGDVVLINNNNYFTFCKEIFNGDMAKVVSVGNIEKRSNIPVTRKGIKKYISLDFRDVELLYPGEEQSIHCKIIESLLDSKNRDITAFEQRALYIDFCMRHPKLKDGTDEFKLALKTDKYFNALKIKYGYAITCHKAQGGEWEAAFVDYFGHCGLDENSLRWCYTATTRARRDLFILNPPQITTFTNLKFSPITKVTSAPSDYYNKEVVFESVFDKEPVSVGVKIKLSAIANAIADTPFSIKRVQHCSYMEKIEFICNENENILIQAYYDKSGVFKRLGLKGDGSLIDQLNAIINEAAIPDLEVAYIPSSTVLMELYQRVTTACNDTGVVITNIQEHIDKYYVLYCLKTDAAFAYIQFYFGENCSFSTAIPKSEMGDQDEKLINLIGMLQ